MNIDNSEKEKKKKQMHKIDFGYNYKEFYVLNGV